MEKRNQYVARRGYNLAMKQILLENKNETALETESWRKGEEKADPMVVQSTQELDLFCLLMSSVILRTIVYNLCLLFTFNRCFADSFDCIRPSSSFRWYFHAFSSQFGFYDRISRHWPCLLVSNFATSLHFIPLNSVFLNFVASFLWCNDGHLWFWHYKQPVRSLSVLLVLAVFEFGLPKRCQTTCVGVNAKGWIWILKGKST